MARDKATEGPDERVMIFLDTPAPGAEGEELPFRMAVVGDFTGQSDDTPLQDEKRKPKEIDNKNFNEILASMNVSTSFNVNNQLKPGKMEIPVDLKFKSIKDFNPDQVAKQVPALRKLVEYRNNLVSLKGLRTRDKKKYNELRSALKSIRERKSEFLG